MASKADEILNSERFRSLMRRRWTVSIVLLVLLFILYYGYVLIVAYGKVFLASKIGINTNWGILLGVGTIICAWLLTVYYVIWANKVYDNEVEALKNELLK